MTRFSALLAVMALALAGSCARPPRAIPNVPAPPVEARADPRPELPASTLAFALDIDLKRFEPLLSDALRGRFELDQRAWTRVTGEHDSPEIETRMHARLGEPELTVTHGALEVTIPVAYFGDVRARARTPFGRVWLSKGTDFGTEKAPGYVVLTIEVRPQIGRDFALETKSVLKKVSFTAPPGGKLCTDTLIRVCVSREEAAKRAHERVERELRSAAPEVLAALDRRIARDVDLRAAVELAQRALATSSEGGLAVLLQRIGLGELSGKKNHARFDAELSFRTRRGGAAGAGPEEAPPRSEPTGQPSELHFDLALSYGEVARAWETAFRSFVHQDRRVFGAEILGADASSGALVLAFRGGDETSRFTLYATALPRVRGATLAFEKLVFTPASKKALEAARVSERELGRELAARLELALSPFADAYADALRRKLSLPLLAFGTLSLRLIDPRFSELYYARDAVIVRVSSGGRSELAN